MDLGLQGKYALVTGASRGLGYAAAHKLAEEGCRVALILAEDDLNNDRKRMIRKRGLEHYYFGKESSFGITNHGKYFAIAANTRSGAVWVARWLASIDVVGQSRAIASARSAS